MTRADGPPGNGDAGDDGTTGAASTRRRFLGAVGTAGAAALAGCPDTGGTAGRDVIALESLSVGGSPGGTVPLRPREGVALIDFFATWCAPCRPQMRSLREVRSTFDPGELHMVSVTTESDEEAIRRFWTTYEGTWPVAMDPETESVQAYSVRGVPTLVLVAADGTVTWRHQGLAGVDSLIAEIERAVA